MTECTSNLPVETINDRCHVVVDISQYTMHGWWFPHFYMHHNYYTLGGAYLRMFLIFFRLWPSRLPIDTHKKTWGFEQKIWKRSSNPTTSCCTLDSCILQNGECKKIEKLNTGYIWMRISNVLRTLPQCNVQMQIWHYLETNVFGQ